MKRVSEAVAENENEKHMKFRNRVAAKSRTVAIFLQSEGEEYGMTSRVYSCLMAYKKANPVLFNSMSMLGNFSLEGSSSYTSKKVIIVIPNDVVQLSSFVPPSFMEVVKDPGVT